MCKSSGIIRTQPQTKGRSDADNILRPGNRKDEFLMQSNSTRVPYFPANLDDYAPWVAEFGLYAPYGECQCGCGKPAGLARDNVPTRGLEKGEPVRFVRGHAIPKEKRDPAQATPEGYTDGLCVTCTKCGQSKPATTEYFGTSELGRYGLRSQCKGCCNKAAREWGKANPGVQAQRTRKWRAANLEQRSLYLRAYRRANPDIIRMISRRCRARQFGAEGTHTIEDVKRQYEAQDGKCYYCGAVVGDTYHVDHIVPLSRGGTDNPDNLAISCPLCNQRKGDRTPDEWLGGNE